MNRSHVKATEVKLLSEASVRVYENTTVISVKSNEKNFR